MMDGRLGQPRPAVPNRTAKKITRCQPQSDCAQALLALFGDVQILAEQSLGCLQNAPKKAADRQACGHSSLTDSHPCTKK